jgi:hypothetical protein
MKQKRVNPSQNDCSETHAEKQCSGFGSIIQRHGSGSGTFHHEAK